MDMRQSQAGIDFLKMVEKLELIGYRDGAGIPTAGWGHTGPGVIVGQPYTEAQCVTWLIADTGWAVAAVNGATVDVPTQQCEFDAMTSLCFRIGPKRFRGSTVLREHRAGKGIAAADGFTLWDKIHVDGALVVNRGEERRATFEKLLYLAQPLPVW
jgi:lysozyme